MSNSADPTTPFLGLTKPIVNDEAGEDLWGQKLNLNFDLIDDFAASQGVLTEAPEDGKYYVRGERQWLEGNTRAEFNTLGNRVSTNEGDISAVEQVNAAQTTAINTKAPLGPNDGNIYGWQGTTWFQLSGSSFTVTWDQVSGKPSTFPPTLPIPSSGVTGLDSKQLDQDAAIAAINWASLSGKPSTFPPTLPIPSSGVTGLDTKQAAQDAATAAKLSDAPNDGAQYARQSANWVKVTGGATISDNAPAGALPASFWWESDSGALYINYQDPNSTQFVQVNAPGMPEAPVDVNAYFRSGGAWVSGGTLSGALIVNGATNLKGATLVQAPVAGGYVLTADQTSPANGGGGVLGQVGNGAAYGIVGYRDNSGNVYSFYGNAGIVAAAANFTSMTASSVVSIGAGLGVTGYVQVTATGGNHGIVATGSGSGGGVLGYPQGGGIYGGLSYAGYGLYTPYQLYSGQQITGGGPVVVSGLITTTAGGSDVQTTSANTVMTTNGTLRRTTSSIRYKTDVEALQDPWADKVLDLEPIYYLPLNTSDPAGYTRYGFSAEQCYATDPRFSLCEPQTLIGYEEVTHENPDGTTFTTQGEPIYEDKLDIVGTDLNAIVAALQQVIKRQEARIAALEAASGV